jgi:phosphoserine phosphatase
MTSAPHAQDALLIRISGPDRPGITADLATLLTRADLALLDVEQVVVQGRLTLALLVEVPLAEGAEASLRAELLKQCTALGVHAEVERLPPQDRPRTPRQAWAVTLLAPRISAAMLAGATRAAATRGFHVEKIARLSGQGLSSIELILAGLPTADAAGLQADLLALHARLGCDVALQQEGLLRRSKRLVVMDMDSTLIQQEVIDELARLHGVYHQVAGITHRAMNGELDFDAALRERVQLLAGAPESILTEVQSRIELMPGAESLVRVLKRLGYRTAVISGGFIEIAEPIRARLGLDHAFANQLQIADGKLTGRVLGPIVNRARKAELLQTIAKTERIALEQVIAIGDGANDLDMLHCAGLGIAFNAKPVVRDQARFTVNQPNLDAILYLLGIADLETQGL